MTAERTRRVGSSLLVAAWIAAAGWNVPLAAGARTPAAQAPADSAATHRAVLDRYCVTCHNAPGASSKKTEGVDVRNDPTIDQLIAKAIGQETPFPSLELATEDFTGFIGACDVGYSCT